VPIERGAVQQEVYYFVIILSGVRLNPLGTAATTGLLNQPQMMMVTVEQLME
jgi:hypothetical protein